MLDRVSDPVAFSYLYDRPAKKLTTVHDRPELAVKASPADPSRSRPATTDARRLLSLPPVPDKDGNGRPDKPLRWC